MGMGCLVTVPGLCLNVNRETFDRGLSSDFFSRSPKDREGDLDVAWTVVLTLWSERSLWREIKTETGVPELGRATGEALGGHGPWAGCD